MKMELGATPDLRRWPRQAINNAIGKTPEEAPSGTQAPVAQPVDQRMRQQSLNRDHHLAGESFTQPRLPFLVPSSGFGDVRQRVLTDFQPVAHR